MSFNRYTRGGQSGIERKFDALSEDIQRLKICESQTVKVEQTSRGQMLTAVIGSGVGGSSVKQFKLVSVQDDYLTCHDWDGTTEGAEDILIAKVFENRKTGWHGLTVTYTLETPLGGGTRAITYTQITPTYRTAVYGGITEHQAIRPFYVPGKSIIFASQSRNGTGVSAANKWIEQTSRAYAKIA